MEDLKIEFDDYAHNSIIGTYFSINQHQEAIQVSQKERRRKKSRGERKEGKLKKNELNMKKRNDGKNKTKKVEEKSSLTLYSFQLIFFFFNNSITININTYFHLDV